MGILSIIEKLFTFISAAFSAYTEAMDREDGKRMVREEMYEEMVERTERANTAHSLDVDELVRLRRARKDSV